jgi:DNA replication and repair protein RecF
MHIQRLNLLNFRNYSSQAVDLSPGLNIFVGDNAQGKTNLLEAIYVLSLSKSYRTSRETELIKHGELQTAIQAKVRKMAVLDLEAVISQNGPKKLLVNAKQTSASSFMGQLNVVLFTPDSLQLVKGSPSDRRRFLDIQICQIDSVYRSTLLKYQRVLRQRNSLLKDAYHNRSLLNQLPAWDSQLLNLGTRVILRRAQVLADLQRYAQEAHGEISQRRETLEIVYEPFFGRLEPGWSGETIREAFIGELQEKRREELQRGYSLVGPQRDDVVFLINGQELKLYGSQGQQRTAVLAYVLAELQLMHAETGELPVVLLDDVLSELDQSRRSFLLSILNNKAQTIVTTTNLGYFPTDLLAEITTFEIKAGTIV